MGVPGNFYGQIFKRDYWIELSKERMAAADNRPTTKTTFHSDQGVEYTLKDYRQVILK